MCDQDVLRGSRGWGRGSRLVGAGNPGVRIGPGRRARVLVPMPRGVGGVFGNLQATCARPGNSLVTLLSSFGWPHGGRGDRSHEALGVSLGGRGAVFPPVSLAAASCTSAH